MGLPQPHVSLNATYFGVRKRDSEIFIRRNRHDNETAKDQPSIAISIVPACGRNEWRSRDSNKEIVGVFSIFGLIDATHNQWKDAGSSSIGRG